MAISAIVYGIAAAFLSGCRDDDKKTNDKPEEPKEESKGPCDWIDCNNHGTCFERGEDYYCVCDEGYKNEAGTCLPEEKTGRDAGSPNNDSTDLPPSPSHDGGLDGQEESKPCNPSAFETHCDAGLLIFCPDSGLTHSVPYNELPENEFCIEGHVRTCTPNGWQIKVEEDIEDKFLLQECNNNSAPGEGEGEGEGAIPSEGEGEPHPCVGEFGEGTYRCLGTRLEFCTESGWELFQDCIGSECRAEEGACFEEVEREVCGPLQEVVLHRGTQGNAAGQWRTMADDFTCGSVCDAPEDGFPVHNGRDFGENRRTTVRFEVPPETTKLYFAASGVFGVDDVSFYFDGIGPFRDNPFDDIIPRSCVEQEFVIENLTRNNHSLLEDGIVDISILPGPACSGHLDEIRLGSIDAECTPSPQWWSASHCADYIPYRMSLTACHTETEWVPRGRE